MRKIRPALDRLAFKAISVLAVLSTVAALAVVDAVPVSAATTVTGIAPIQYTEGSGPVPIAPNAVVNETGSFADGYVEFSVTGATASESLTLPAVTTPNSTNGAVSVVGSAVYLGLGGGNYKQIGTVDPVKNGLAGAPLRVNFSAVLPNADFSGAVTGPAGAQTPAGWTINRNFLTLGSLASKSQGRAVTKTGSGPYTISGPGYSFQTDANYDPASHSEWGRESVERGASGTYSSDVVAYSGHDKALRLYFSGNCPGPNSGTFCTAFGPEAFSSPFQAKAGDALAFDWAAANGDDNYEVYGFLVNQDTGTTTELMYGRGNVKNWSITSGTIPADGTYKFRFVAGSYDMTGGYAIGASLYIDNVRVLSNDASAAVAQSVVRMVHYENTSNNPAPNRTINVSTATAGNPPTSSTVPTTVTLIDDPPTISTIAPSTFVNTAAIDTFSTATGTIPASDPEGDPITYGLAGATAGSTVIGAFPYDLSKVGSYGTAFVSSATGRWAFVPDAAAINNRLTNDAENFQVTATAKGLVGTGTIPIAISVPASAPGAVTALAATAADAAVELTWAAPAWLGGAAITGYRVERSTDGTNWSTAIADTGSASTSATVSGLSNGTTYRFRVSAINANGRGPVSNVATATPVSVPGVPTSLSAAPGAGTASLSWAAPSNTGGTPVTGYRIETTTDGGATWSVAVANTGTAATTAVVTGLTNGTDTAFRVSAINAVGAGSPSTPTNTVPRTVPQPASDLALTAGDGILTANWTAPSDNGGAAITGYRVETSSDGGTTWTVAIANTGTDATTAVLSGLTNGVTYTVRVAAINVAGTGSASGVSSGKPVRLPDAPTSLSAVPGPANAVLSWSPPADNGGTAVTGYQVETSTDGGATWAVAIADTGSASTTATVNGLANGVNTAFRVSAINAVGVGGPSAPTATVPRTVAGVPTGLQLTHGDSSLALSWTAPSDDGGALITGYRVEVSTDGGASWTTAISDTGSAATTATLLGLVNGTATSVRVSALNVAGAGQPTASETSTPKTVAGAPTIDSLTSGNREVVVKFSPPTDDGGSPITNYEYSLDGGKTWVAASPATTTGPIAIRRLENDVPVTVQLRAVNSEGGSTSKASSPATPHAAPVLPPGATKPPVSPNGGRLLIDGTETDLKLIDAGTVPGSKSPAGTVHATGGGLDLDLLSQDSKGGPVPLKDGRLQLVPGSTFSVEGSGYAPGSSIDVWLMPGSKLLGTVIADSKGRVSTKLAVPEGLAVGGDYGIQLNGVSQDGAARSMSLDVTVRDASLDRGAPAEDGPWQAPPGDNGGSQPPSSKRPSSNRPTKLAFTGGSIYVYLLAGVLMIVTGMESDRHGRRVKRHSK